VALTPLLVEQRNALQSAEAAFSVLIEQYHSIGVHAAGGVVEAVSGVDQVAHRFHQLQRAPSGSCRFRSHLEPDVYSQGLPLLFPSYDLPLDAMNTLPAQGDIVVGPSAEGHAGYTPGAITAASLSYSYDGGVTWTEATTEEHADQWTAVLDHAGASGKQVTLKVPLTDAGGNAVSQTVTRADDVR
jgi:hypothetical protein